MKKKYYEALGTKYDKLQSAMVVILKRFIESGTEGDIETRERKLFIKYIIISKMQARILDELVSRTQKIIKRFDGIRISLGDPYYEQDDYIHVKSCLMEYEDRIRQNAMRVYEIAMYVDTKSAYFSESELRSMLSIGYEDWKYWLGRNNTLMTMLVTKVGNEPLAHHVMDYMMNQIMGHPEARKMMRQKAEEIFPELFPRTGGDSL
ncbi:hypothetical protein [Paenibacillus polymyxa]|uniref:hypothetical protein n=1 Tax=Paenibacillus polymyxa TaxID=1406 RepID=UPI000845CC4E|nr:hypothetical protein [Paenibacillus polymyxa]AOK91973.1 hypothetical protein AOU00_20420 [Paenibacillus polymyxa]